MTESEPLPVDAPPLPPGYPAASEPTEAPELDPPGSTGARVDGSRSGSRLPLLLGFLFAFIGAGVVFVGLSIVGGDGEAADEPVRIGDQAPSDAAEETAEANTSTTPVAESSSPTVSKVPTPTTATTTRQTTAPVSRPATLYAGIARLRSDPQLNATVLREISGRQGTAIVVIGADVNGWSLIEIDGEQGWIFGAFVLPPEAAYAVAETLNDAGAVLTDASGNRLGIENSSGNKVLITTFGETLHTVLLPEGTVAYVLASDVRIVS